MFLEIITPDKKVFEGEVDSAIFPGSNGSFQILNDHAPMVSSIKQGDIKIAKTVENKEQKTKMIVTGGVVEVLNNKILVLAESVIA